MLHETIIDNIKDNFLGHLAPEDVKEEELTNVAAYTVAYLEENNLEVTPENISQNAEKIKAYMKNDGQNAAAPSKAVESLSIEERIAKLEKNTKMVISFGWIFMAAAFLYVFVAQPGSSKQA